MRCNSERTQSSGLVSFARMRDIFRLRRSGVIVSINHTCPLSQQVSYSLGRSDMTGEAERHCRPARTGQSDSPQRKSYLGMSAGALPP